MRYLKSEAGLLAALCLITAHHAWGDTMRCGDKLVENGESMVAVKALCGAPASVEQGVKDEGPNEVPTETWTYNRGPDQFMVSIRFVDGKVVAIETLHQYGY